MKHLFSGFGRDRRPYFGYGLSAVPPLGQSAGQMQCRTTSYCRHPRPGRFPWKMKTWVSFRIERTKIGIINYNKKTTAGKTPAVVLH